MATDMHMTVLVGGPKDRSIQAITAAASVLHFPSPKCEHLTYHLRLAADGKPFVDERRYLRHDYVGAR